MQAFLITAYKDKEQLVRLINKLNNMGKVFVHLDKKSKKLSVDELKSLELTNTIFTSDYEIFWGNFNHVKAILKLIEMASNDEDIDYIHLISGQDYPVKTKEEFEAYFSSCESIFMSCSDETMYGQEVRARYSYWYPVTNGNPQSLWYKATNKSLLMLQKVFGYKNDSIREFDKVYKGMIWASMPITAAKYVLEYWNSHKNFRNRMRHIRLSEEFLFQTVLMNSIFKDNIVKDSLRYNDWEHAIGGSPAVIDEKKYNEIVASEKFFARKFESGRSDKLVVLLEEKNKI